MSQSNELYQVWQRNARHLTDRLADRATSALILVEAAARHPEYASRLKEDLRPFCREDLILAVRSANGDMSVKAIRSQTKGELINLLVQKINRSGGE